MVNQRTCVQGEVAAQVVEEGEEAYFLFYDYLTPPVTNIVFHLHGTKKIRVLVQRSEKKSICNDKLKLV